MMLGAVIKNYFAAAVNKSPDEVVSVSVMPCVRKQGEADRPWFATTGVARDVDHVITTVELAKILQAKGVDPEALEESEFDAPLGEGSGGGQLFGTTGGVMEAALRTVAEVVTGKKMDGLVYEGVRGLEGVREATLSLQPGEGTPLYELMMPPAAAAGGAAFSPPPPLEIRVAVANGLGNAKKLVKAMAEGESKYDFVEVMACPGGCICGGGQPRSADKQVAQKRQAAIYAIDEKQTLRRPHENAFIQRLYANFLEGRPGSHKAHELLHTHYVKGGVDGGSAD
jgi:iron only hydrogenase large subunit-like protein